MTTDYREDSWVNRWTNETITPVTGTLGINEQVPLNQFIYTQNVLNNTDSLVFDVYDRQNNQVFFFDLFLETENGNLGTKLHTQYQGSHFGFIFPFLSRKV